MALALASARERACETSAGGAFAGLRQPQASAGVSLDARRSLPQPASAGLGTDAGASFSLGGVARGAGGGGSLNADVGQLRQPARQVEIDNQEVTRCRS
ncbi:MAG: hypothetical protein M0C28_32780 [Candidatus Moduliflexus flocculans]|nr:hypothetical protein [Candidatus Moduliflexus flocculans]